MANLGDWAQFLLAMLPLINLIVALIEKLFPSSTGVEKKAMAMDVAKSLVPSISRDALVSVDVLSTAIDNQVALFNAAGAFAHAGLTALGEYPSV